MSLTGREPVDMTKGLVESLVECGMKPSRVAQALMRQGVRKLVIPYIIHKVMIGRRMIACSYSNTAPRKELIFSSKGVSLEHFASRR